MTKLILAVSIIIFFKVNASAQGGGNSIGNGGDHIAAEFIAVARQAINLLQYTTLPEDLQNCVVILKQNIDLIHVSSEKSLTLNNNSVDAINYPDLMQIKVSREGWQFTKSKLAIQKYILVIHEYLGVNRINDQHYENSTKLAQAITNQFNENSLGRESVLSLKNTSQLLLNIQSNISENTEDINKSDDLKNTKICSLIGSAVAYSKMLTLALNNQLSIFLKSDRYEINQATNNLDLYSNLNETICTSSQLQINVQDFKQKMLKLDKSNQLINKIILQTWLIYN